jgi:hypothetical protein
MKKLLSVLAVAAIVTSAFAFTTNKETRFCLRNASGTACQIVNNKVIDPLGTIYKQYPLGLNQWNGNVATCTAAGIANCSQDIPLLDN